MDYEKAYKEALERARKLYNEAIANEYTSDAEDYLTIFPELAESEDERIRKHLIQFLKGEVHEIDVEETLSWLVKQKERGRNITTNLLEDGITGVQRELIEFLANNIDAPWVDVIKSADAYAQRIRSMVEKKKEQKEIPLMNGDADLYFDNWIQQHSNPTKRECFEAGMLYVVRLSTEDSPMLEEFKKGLEQVILWGREGYKVSSDGTTKSLTQDEIDEVLNEQKEQKPAEWSEEDERIIDTIVSVLGQYIDYKTVSGTGSEYATPRYSKEIAWLKSLRPHWKPSEEQIYSLGTVVKGYDECTVGSVGYHLKEMYEQLKKLI